MAFNAFRELVVDGKTNEVIVKGVSDPPLGKNAEIVVVLMENPRDPKALRCRHLVDNPTATGWRATFPHSEAPFVKPRVEVVVAGTADSDSTDLFIWGDKIAVSDPKPVL